MALYFLCLLHVHTWSEGATSKMQAKKGKMQAKGASSKRAMFSRLGGLAFPCGYLSLSLLAFSLEPCF